jgi:hypothetical protein
VRSGLRSSAASKANRCPSWSSNSNTTAASLVVRLPTVECARMVVPTCGLMYGEITLESKRDRKRWH